MTVGIIMGSKSDWPTMKHAADMLDLLNVPYETKVVSAHRTPHLLAEYAESAKSKGIKVFICGAGGSAALAGVVAAQGVTALYLWDLYRHPDLAGLYAWVGTWL